MKIGDKIQTTPEYNAVNYPIYGIVIGFVGATGVEILDVNKFKHRVIKKVWLE